MNRQTMKMVKVCRRRSESRRWLCCGSVQAPDAAPRLYLLFLLIVFAFPFCTLVCLTHSLDSRPRGFLFLFDVEILSILRWCKVGSSSSRRVRWPPLQKCSLQAPHSLGIAFPLCWIFTSQMTHLTCLC